MSHIDGLSSLHEKADDTAERIVQHLLRSPCDLADIRHLLRLFQASAADFQQAFARLEKMADQPYS